MPWEVLTLPPFDEWFESLDPGDQDAIDARIGLLKEFGPTLGRPTVDTLGRSRHHNMKELRTEGTLRAFFIFDPSRQAVILTAGDKRGVRDQDKWYRQKIGEADDLYDEYLTGQKSGGGGDDEG